MAYGHAVELRSAQLDEITTRAGNAALLQVYTSPRPATGAAITSQTKLAQFTCGSPFAPSAASGVLSPALPADVVGLASGQANWFRIVKSDGTTHVTDFGLTEATLNNQNVSVGGVVKVLGWTITAGNP